MKPCKPFTLGKVGLYSLRRDELRLRGERRDWEREFLRLEKKIEAAYDELDEEIQKTKPVPSRNKSRPISPRLRTISFILIGMAFLGFLGLAWVISGGIRRQVGAIEKARSDADINQHKAESLLVEQRKAAEALKHLSRHNELILNSAGEGIFGLDAEGNTSFINVAGARMIGWKVEELVGKPQHATLHHTRSDGTPCRMDLCPIYAAIREGGDSWRGKRDIVEKGWNPLSH